MAGYGKAQPGAPTEEEEEPEEEDDTTPGGGSGREGSSERGKLMFPAEAGPALEILVKARGGAVRVRYGPSHLPGTRVGTRCLPTPALTDPTLTGTDAANLSCVLRFRSLAARVHSPF